MLQESQIGPFDTSIFSHENKIPFLEFLTSYFCFFLYLSYDFIDMPKRCFLQSIFLDNIVSLSFAGCPIVKHLFYIQNTTQSTKFLTGTISFI